MSSAEAEIPMTEIDNGEPLTSSNSLLVSLVKPTAMESNGPNSKHELLKVNALKTQVHQLKSHVSSNWPGKPKVEGIRLIARGRVLNDNELINMAVSSSPGDDSTHSIHVVVRPNAWTEKVTATPMPVRPASAPPTAQAEVTPHPNLAATITSLLSNPPESLVPPPHPLNPDLLSAFPPPVPALVTPLHQAAYSSHLAIFSHFYNLTQPQRKVFIENLYKAQFSLVERLETLRLRLYNNQIDVLGLQRTPAHKDSDGEFSTQEEDERWKVVDEKLTKLLTDLQYMGTYVEPYEPNEFQDYQLAYQNFQQNRPSEYERVEIGGLPFLLHIPRTFQMQAQQDAFLQNLATRMPPTSQVTIYKKLKKDLNRTLHLEKRLQLLLLQIKRLEAHFNQVDNLLSSSHAAISNFSLPSIGQSANVRIHAVPNLAAAAGVNGAPGAPGQQLMFIPPLQPGGLNVPPAPNPGAAQAPVPGGPGMALGIGPNAMGLVPAEWMIPPNNPGAAVNAGGWPNNPGTARVRRYEFTINVDGIRRYFVPLSWLAFKLFCLLYIFGKHASANKRSILTGLAIGWWLWEAYTIYQRHEAQTRRRERIQRHQAGAAAVGGGGAAGPVDPVQAALDRGRRQAERERRAQRAREQLRVQARQERERAEVANLNQNSHSAAAPLAPTPNATAQGVPVPNVQAADAPPNVPAAQGAEDALPVERVPEPPNAPILPRAPLPPIDDGPQRPIPRNLRAIGQEIRARGGAFPPGTEVRPFRATSIFSPKYWFNSIAVVGLASEYRELGLHPIGDATPGSSNNDDVPIWWKWFRNAKICLILFVGTLLPEIEKKRKKALEKRARILRMVMADAAREQHRQQIESTGPAPAAPPATTEGDGPADPNRPPPTPRPPRLTFEGTVRRRLDQGSSVPPTVVSASGVDVTQHIPGGSSLVSRHHAASSSVKKAAVREDEAATATMTLETPTPSTSTLLPSSLPITTPTAAAPVVAQPNLADPELSTSSPTTQVETLPTLEIPVMSPRRVGNSDDLNRDAAAADTSANAAADDFESPLTPINERAVVPGLDDTDDEELAGAGEDEAGMMLF